MFGYFNITKKLGKTFSSQARGEKIALTTLRYLKLVNKRLNPRVLLEKALDKLNTGIKIISQVKAGRTIYLPAYQSKSTAQYKGLGWIFKAAGERSTKGFKSKYLATEIRDVLLNRGRTIKLKYDHIKLIRDSRMNLRKRRLKKLRVKNLIYIRRYWHPFYNRWTYPNAKIRKTKRIFAPRKRAKRATLVVSKIDSHNKKKTKKLSRDIFSQLDPNYAKMYASAKALEKKRSTLARLKELALQRKRQKIREEKLFASIEPAILNNPHSFRRYTAFRERYNNRNNYNKNQNNSNYNNHHYRNNNNSIKQNNNNSIRQNNNKFDQRQGNSNNNNFNHKHQNNWNNRNYDNKSNNNNRNYRDNQNNNPNNKNNWNNKNYRDNQNNNPNNKNNWNNKNYPNNAKMNKNVSFDNKVTS